MEKKKRRRRIGDRKDGRRVRTCPAIHKVMPYIMNRRYDAMNMFTDKLYTANADQLVRQKVKEGKTNFSILHILIASYVRAVSQRPALNRFISGQKIYTRDKVVVNMAIKHKMNIDAEETMIKVEFDPADTLDDIYDKFTKVADEALAAAGNSNFDKVAKFLSNLPGFIFRFAVWFLRCLDYVGWLPKFLTNEVSPFHGSMIITSMGSLGIPPIYHHLYDFGNLPVFLAYGAKQTELALDAEGNVTKKKYVELKAVTDERICDGFYYASCFKIIRRCFENPECLLTPPEQVFEDVD